MWSRTALLKPLIVVQVSDLGRMEFIDNDRVTFFIRYITCLQLLSSKKYGPRTEEDVTAH